VGNGTRGCGIERRRTSVVVAEADGFTAGTRRWQSLLTLGRWAIGLNGGIGSEQPGALRNKQAVKFRDKQAGARAP
jgi:hypothetical protein